MEPFQEHTGIACLLQRNNIDTDLIIPKQFLKKVERSGFGKHLFHDWRYLEDGSDNQEFELNQPVFKGASILVAGDNFGCGSSREHAPWALLDYGFRVIVSTSFADIFFSNCFKNGILPIRVSQENLTRLMDEISAQPGTQFTISLEKQCLSTPKGNEVHFEIDNFRKNSLLKGLDDISWTLEHKEKIEAFETRQKADMPWLWES